MVAATTEAAVCAVKHLHNLAEPMGEGDMEEGE